MGTREALLVGIERYGDGFAVLPAVLVDLQRMDAALRACGYTTRRIDAELQSDPTGLDREIRAFCASGGPDDIRLVYFTGHGLRIDDKDWIVPAGATRDEVLASQNLRVSTDLSLTVAASTVGLVLFVIDACRDREDVPLSKGGSGWGDPAGLSRPGGQRFVRWFGCGADQVCQVVSSEGAAAGSLFTEALSDALSTGEVVSLADAQREAEGRCQRLLDRHIHLRQQKPHLALGELTDEVQQMLQRPIFDPVGEAALAGVWRAFEPSRLHVLVVLSEHACRDPQAWGLANVVSSAVVGKSGNAIWQAFHTARDGQRLVDGRVRRLPERFVPDSLAYCTFSVLEAFAGDEAFDKAVRALAEADLVVFDVTGFEPAMMLLAGIRSAARRGVSVSSHGGGWEEGQPLKIPFNLQDINLNSHTKVKGVGDNVVIQRFVRRVESGFRQLVHQPAYGDLPGFDALRQLGADYDASSTIGVGERVLVLCSFDEKFDWNFVAEELKKSLWRRANITPEHIDRIIDYGTPQLVLQGLYEQIRRTAACVVDWSEFREAVFLELGARLAASEWGAVQIIQRDHLPGGARAPALAQVMRMHRLLQPLVYQYADKQGSGFDAVAEALARGSANTTAPKSPGFNRVYRGLQDALGGVQEATAPVAVDLQRRADGLHHPKQGEVGAPQVIYAGSREIKRDAESAALELRIAAWLYLEHRTGKAGRRADARAAEQYKSIGRIAANALFDLGDEASIALALQIEQRLDEEDRDHA